MPRLIDADALMDVFCDNCGNAWRCRAPCIEYEQVMHAPTIDAEPVVRCKDCEYFEYGNYCSESKMEHSKCRPDDFCSYGKRKTAEVQDERKN